MHEWALSESVIVSVIEYIKTENLKKVNLIEISMGELQKIDEDIFRFALDELIKSEYPNLKKIEFKIKKQKIVFRCNCCHHEWGFGDINKKLSESELESIHFIPETIHIYDKCPKCKSSDFEIIKGRGVWIDSIE